MAYEMIHAAYWELKFWNIPANDYKELVKRHRNNIERNSKDIEIAWPQTALLFVRF